MDAWTHILQESNMTAGSKADVLVVIPTIPGREKMLDRALRSIRDEEVRFTVNVLTDREGKGPAVQRNRGVFEEASHGAKWLALLDDDDEFHPGHLTKCVRHAEATGADVVYPWFDLMRGNVLRNDTKVLLQQDGTGDKVDAFEKPFSADALTRNNYIPVTTVIRMAKFREVGGFPRPGSEEWPHQDCEDWGLWQRMVRAGAKFSHLPERTWTWNWHGKNTSGRPDRARQIYGERNGQ
jgi:hypothetical protein